MFSVPTMLAVIFLSRNPSTLSASEFSKPAWKVAVGTHRVNGMNLSFGFVQTPVCLLPGALVHLNFLGDIISTLVFC